MLYYRCTTNGGNMEYKFYCDEYHEGFLGETPNEFIDWLNGTSKEFFICEEQSEYFKYIDSVEIDSYLDYKRGYETKLCIIQCNETKEYYGFEYTMYHHGDSQCEDWEKYDRIKTRPVVYKYRKAS
tara:strand:+ start:79 stop:456 length:378 start_codon:yes stop_codon:yes gene_type:complete